jgi:hypothetical protein
MLRPHRGDLFVRRELTPRRLRQGCSERRFLRGGQLNRWLFLASDQQNPARDIILRGSGKITRGTHGSFKKVGHVFTHHLVVRQSKPYKVRAMCSTR